jgi:hypothetical protein
MTGNLLFLHASIDCPPRFLDRTIHVADGSSFAIRAQTVDFSKVSFAETMVH